MIGEVSATLKRPLQQDGSANSDGGEKRSKPAPSSSKKTERKIVWQSLVEYVIACGGSKAHMEGWRIKSEKSSSSSTPVRSYTNAAGATFHSRADVARSLGLIPVSFSVAQQISRRVKLECEAAAAGKTMCSTPPGPAAAARPAAAVQPAVVRAADADGAAAVAPPAPGAFGGAGGSVLSGVPSPLGQISWYVQSRLLRRAHEAAA